MPKKSGLLELSPFPPMTWSDYDCWEGFIGLSFGGEVALNVVPSDASVSRMPSEAQRESLAFLLANSEQVFASALRAIRPYYEKMRPLFKEYLGEAFDSEMPELKQAEDLKNLIELCAVHIDPEEREGTGYVGLQFRSWDHEHGLGLLVHRDRVVHIGEADVSFAVSPRDFEA